MKLFRSILARFRPAPVVRREPTELERVMLKAVLEAIHDNLVVARSVSRAYEAEQAERVDRARRTYRLVYGAPLIFPNLAARITMGDTINVRRPARFRMPVPGDFRPAQESAK